MDPSAKPRLAPNPECVTFCPLLAMDEQAARQGHTPMAEQDYQRHLAQSNECTGTTQDARWSKRICPLFGVEATL